MLARFSADLAQHGAQTCLVAEPGSAVDRIIELVNLRTQLPVFASATIAGARYR